MEGHTEHYFVSVTLIHKVGVDILKGTCRPKMEFLGQGFQKLEVSEWSDRHTDRCSRMYGI